MEDSAVEVKTDRVKENHALFVACTFLFSGIYGAIATIAAGLLWYLGVEPARALLTFALSLPLAVVALWLTPLGRAHRYPWMSAGTLLLGNASVILVAFTLDEFGFIAGAYAVMCIVAAFFVITAGSPAESA